MTAIYSVSASSSDQRKSKRKPLIVMISATVIIAVWGASPVQPWSSAVASVGHQSGSPVAFMDLNQRVDCSDPITRETNPNCK